MKWFSENQNKLNATKGFFFCLSMLCYSLYCLFLAFCTLKLWDRESSESTNYATKRHKTHNHGSIIKLFLKELKSIIMHSTLENYIFFTYLLYVSRSIVYSIILFKSKYFWLQNSFGKIEMLNFLLFLLAWICFGCKV